jgi:hypothetical protein
MKKDNVFAYVLMEEMSEPVQIRNVKECSKNGLLYLIFDTVLQSFEVKNRNKRTYIGDAVMESLAAPHVQELIKKGSFVSEYGHPLVKDMSRVTQIDPARVCGRVNSYYRTGNLLKGEFETFDDGGLGTMLTRRILQGLEPAHSLRAVAKLSKDRNGNDIMNSRAHIIAYDTVILPSHVEAYRDESKDIRVVNQPIVATESAEFGSHEEYSFVVNESMLTDFVMEESKNVKLIKNICEVIPETIKLTPDLKHIILKEGTETYYVDTEDKIKHDIRNFLSNF